jgi:hypothetical protein
MVPQIPNILCKPHVHYRAQNSPPRLPVLSLINAVSSQLLESPILILSSHLLGALHRLLIGRSGVRIPTAQKVSFLCNVKTGYQNPSPPIQWEDVREWGVEEDMSG